MSEQDRGAPPAGGRPKRKWQMIRVKAGDYLLPSNDLQTLYRVYSYHEDGSARTGEWPNETPLVGMFWAGARYLKPMPEIGDPELGNDLSEDVPLLDWDDWTEVITMQPKRQDVIDYVVGR